jgi:hypothetical protein
MKMPALLLTIALGSAHNACAEESATAPKRMVIDDETTIQTISKQMGITGLRSSIVGDKKRIVDLNHDFMDSAKSKTSQYFKWK